MKLRTIQLAKSVHARLFVVLSVILLTGCSKPTEQVHLSGPTMGTGYNVKYIVQDEQPKPEVLQKEIDKVLEKVNDEMSTYRPDSELSRFNQHTNSEPFSVSSDTAAVVREALRINKLTEGAMDVTVGPIVNLWGFGPEDRPDVVPTPEMLSERRQITGIQHLSETGDALIKDIPELYVDLSSIAKGRGTDEVADYLESVGIHNYMVEVGGKFALKVKTVMVCLGVSR